MAIKADLQFKKKKIDVTGAYIAIETIQFNRHRFRDKQVDVHYAVYPDQESAVNDPQDSLLFRQKMTFNLADLEAELGLNLHEVVYSRLKQTDYDDVNVHIGFSAATDVLTNVEKRIDPKDLPGGMAHPDYPKPEPEPEPVEGEQVA